MDDKNIFFINSSMDEENSALTTTTNSDLLERVSRRCLIILLLFGIFFAGINIEDRKLPKFHVDSVLLSPFDINAPKTTTNITNWKLTLSVESPASCENIHYEAIRVSLFHRKEFITVVVAKPFYQAEAEETTLMKLSFVASKWPIDNWVVRALDTGRIRGEAGGLSVGVQARITSNPGSSSERKEGIKVFCKNLVAEFVIDTRTKTWSAPIGKRCSVWRREDDFSSFFS